MDTIKIDKMFVDTIATDSTAASFLETIVRMAEILSLHVVVEGIETAQQTALIASFGSVSGQGYHLGRPMAVGAMDCVLRAAIPEHGWSPYRNRRSSPGPRPPLVTLAPPCLADRSSPLAG